MVKAIHLKNDLKQIFRDPIMVILFILPVFITIIFKILMIYIVPMLETYFEFEMSNYYSYLLGTTFIFTPSMLGTVIGFIMLDDKDGKIAELMSITPLGHSGYLFNRLSFAVLWTFIYSIITYNVMDIYHISTIIFIYIILLLGILTIIFGIILFSIAEDKVKGLTYAKGMNVILLMALADLLNIRWVSILASFFPTYWITKIIQNPKDLFTIVIGGLVHLIWLILILGKEMRYKP